MKVYTRKGDDGTTGLLHGGRVAKDSSQPTAYGDVDEAQAVIGLARAVADGFGFMEAYSAYCRPLSMEEKDRSYREAEPVATLFQAHGAPRSVADQQRQFAAIAPLLEPHPIIGNFLDIMAKTPGVPAPLHPFQAMMIRAAVALLPDWARAQLELDGPQWRLRRWDGLVVRRLGALFVAAVTGGNVTAEIVQTLLSL